VGGLEWRTEVIKKRKNIEKGAWNKGRNRVERKSMQNLITVVTEH
jgi:hypothetical protein